MTLYDDSDRSPRRRSTPSARGFALCAVLAGLGLLVGSCDTTAKVSFPTRSYRIAHSSGFIAPAGQCGSLGVGENGSTVKMRFALVAGDDTPIRPNQALNKGAVNIDQDAIETTNSSIFEYPDLTCGGGGGGAGSLIGPGVNYPGSSGDAGTMSDAGNGTDTGNGGGNGNGGNGGSSGERVLQYDGMCTQSGYSCGKAKEGVVQDLSRCHKGTNLTVQEGVDFVSDTSKSQRFGVLVENSRSLGGDRSPAVDNFYDRDGDGQAEVSVQTYNDDLQTDPNGNRATALVQLRETWKTVREDALAENRETRFGLWEITGEPNPPSVVDKAAGEQWTRSPSDAQAATDTFDTDVDRDDTANVFESILNLVTDHYGQEDEEKALVVFVDGPPTTPVAFQDQYSVQDVIDRAKAANVRVFVVHLDAALPVTELYDDPRYWDAQDSNCSSDSDCRNFETCREPHGYATQRNGSTSVSGTYCMPQYRPDGRIGPVFDYARLACETKGGYIYIKSARNDLEPTMKWLPYTMDGLWEAEFTIPELEPTQQKFSPGKAIRLQSSVGITAGGTNRTIEFSQIGGNHESTIPESGDTRSVLFTGKP